MQAAQTSTTPHVQSDKQKAIEKKKCLTPIFRLSFPALFTPKSIDGKQEAKYQATMLFEKSVDLSKPADKQRTSLKHAAYNAAVEKWGADKAKWPKNLRMPFRDGDEKEFEGYPGNIFVYASSKKQPGIVDQGLRKILNEQDIYAGCYCRAEVIAFAYDTSGNRGVSFSLQNIQKVKDGTPFSGRKDASEVFEAVEDVGGGSEDPANYGDVDLGGI